MVKPKIKKDGDKLVIVFKEKRKPRKEKKRKGMFKSSKTWGV